jgi:uncharacterized protein (TIGR01777 family)
LKVLITGITGLIGKEVGKILVQHGHSVVGLSRDVRKAGRELPFPVTLFPWAGGSEAVPAQALSGVDAVVNLAGESIAGGRWTPARKKKIYDSRIDGTRSLINSITQNPETKNTLKAFVHGSAIGYYGKHEDDVIDEEVTNGKGFLAEVTRDWEAEAERLKSDAGTQQIRLVKVRTGLVFARHGGALQKMFSIFSHGLGGRLGDGKQWVSWIHIEDIANLIVFCLENQEVSGVINGVAPEPVRNDRFTIELARALARPVFLPVPEQAIRAALGEMASAVLDSQRVQPKRALELGFTYRHPELVHALHEICEPLKNGQHELLSEQWVPQSPEKIFPYFSSETNLEELTPKFLNFRVLGKSTPQIGVGTLIDYRLSVHGIPLKWRSRIEEWVSNRKFVDVQLTGPYKSWHHTHEFEPLAGGTLMRDRVLYKLPLGFLGDIAMGWRVAGDVSTIFDFRRKKIDEIFGAGR